MESGYITGTYFGISDGYLMRGLNVNAIGVGTISRRLYSYTVNPKIIAAIYKYMRLRTVAENNVAERPFIAGNQLQFL